MPMALRRAKGATIEDVDGNIYIDFFAGAGVMNVGHGNPAVIEAAGEQIGELTHTLDIPSPARVSMVEALCEVLPEELGKIFFGGPTGSDAVEAAMKLAKYNTGRYPMISFEGAYHGMTSGALSLCSGSPFKGDFLPLLPERCISCPTPTAIAVPSIGSRRAAIWNAGVIWSTWWRTPIQESGNLRRSLWRRSREKVVRSYLTSGSSRRSVRYVIHTGS
jgi:4-aminobutyrate aminotransferase-like enzyme